ncbi:MAG TPA: BTAD domain-containing putative transcriptional regulator, partial [Herpetosiphonaceae bacterium]|nr:BTAD domain-containing putative transcriptional regulator [Herpetosiphonaceae bacterium]
MPTPSDEHIRPTLQIAVLGAPMVTWNNTALPIARRQTRALLYRLAIPLTPVPRTQLCYLFWPDIPDATARRNLTHLLTLLRRALPQPDLLVIEAETVGFLPHQVWSDADVFARLTRTAGAQIRPAALIEAIDLCRGPLLDGFALPNCPEFESWLDLERSTWERRFDDAMAAVVEIHTVAGNFGAAIAAAERYLRRDDVAEEMHRRLIALYAAAGNRTAALRQFEQCVIVLERELGVGPLPETRAVYEAVRDGFFPLSPQAVPRPAPQAALARQTTGTTGSTPSPPSPLIGRTSVLKEVIALLRSPDLRLLTCCGPGGAGKTRLALEAIRSLAAEFADGVVFVPLATLRDPALVIPAIVAALGLAEHDARPPLVHLQDALRMRELLLVLDNFEHVAEAARDVAALLAAAPRLKLLVTSRALLRIAGEHAYPVPPLDLPDVGHLPPPTELAEVGAVALFLTRVRERMSDFDISENNATDIATICARLDGLPLAIELAAARAALLSPRMVLARLDRRL